MSRRATGGPPVVAIGLDSADIRLCTRWMDEGRMPHLAALRERGRAMALRGSATHTAEVNWANFATGAPPEETGYWSPLRLTRGTYSVTDVGSYAFDEYPPFYALGKGWRVAAIDVPQTRLSDDVEGVQLLAWGAHSSYAEPSSRPPELYDELISRYGPHPTLDRDRARLWRRRSMEKLAAGLVKGCARRAAMTADLLSEGDWDLVLVVFSELHSGGHYLLHLDSPEHPLHEAFGNLFRAMDPLTEVAVAIDEAVGRIVTAAGPEATVVVFSQEGMVPNNMDVPSMLFLPELLYRWSFPGKMGMRGAPPGDESRPEPPITHPYSFGWARKCWTLKHDPNPLRRTLRRWMPVEAGRLMERFLGAPDGVGYINDYDPWFQPAMWYSDHWPRMRAFGLPSYSDGYVRINLVGRDPEGKVAPEDYEAVRSELEAEILSLVDSRTGQPVAERVIRTEARWGAPKSPDADLIVQWTARPADCVTSPSLGRIGPVPMSRSGGHDPTGFAIAAGPEVAEADRVAEEGLLIDLAPTLLHLVGAPIPRRLPGRSLID